MNVRVLILVLFVACGLMLCKPALAEEETEEEIKVKFSTGLDYSTGDYGRSSETEIWYWPASAKISYGDWSAKVTVPYLRIKGSDTIVGGGDTIVLDDNSGKGSDRKVTTPITTTQVDTTEEGMGDIIGALTYTIDIEDYDLLVDLTGKIKFPTADENKRLGTGETDYTAQLDITKMFGDAYIFGGVGRRFMGDNEQFQLNDIWLYNAGAGYQISKSFGIGASYDYRESATTVEDPSEATAYLTYKITDSLTALIYGVIGFSDGSPVESAGVQLSYKF
jgi:hypothetical protein